MNDDGFWFWNEAHGVAALSRKDLHDSRELLKRQGADFDHYFAPDESTLCRIQRVAAARSTAHLREAVLYLQLQSNGVHLPAIELQKHGVDLPATEEAKLRYPFLALGRHQREALFNEFERSRIYEFDRSGQSHLRTWQSDMFLGLVPGVYWATDRYYWGFP